MNDEIKNNLQGLLETNLNNLQNSSLEGMFDKLVNENPYQINLDGTITNLYNASNEVKKINDAKKNPRLILAFDKIKKMEFDEKEIVAEFKIDILNSIQEIKNIVSIDNKDLKNQIIFLEYNYEPYAYFCGFGKGNYPILKNPEYFEFNYQEELYNGLGKIDYRKMWKELITINDILEELDIYDIVWSTELYQYLLNSLKFKTYLLLHKAFDQIGIKEFNGIEIEKPLMIYGNEHDCEAINIYAYE